MPFVIAEQHVRNRDCLDRTGYRRSEPSTVWAAYITALATTAGLVCRLATSLTLATSRHSDALSRVRRSQSLQLVPSL
jgi:hypothetical protein